MHIHMFMYKHANKPDNQTHTHTHTHKQINKQKTKKQTNKHANEQTNKRTNVNSLTHTNTHTEGEKGLRRRCETELCVLGGDSGSELDFSVKKGGQHRQNLLQGAVRHL